jgi:hypothetical protein
MLVDRPGLNAHGTLHFSNQQQQVVLFGDVTPFECAAAHGHVQAMKLLVQVCGGACHYVIYGSCTADRTVAMQAVGKAIAVCTMQWLCVACGVVDSATASLVTCCAGCLHHCHCLALLPAGGSGSWQGV